MKMVQPDRGNVVYAVYDKAREPNPTPAGIIGLLDVSLESHSAEIGFVFAFPKYRRIHPVTNMIGLLLEFCLELPENGGLGPWHMQWQANA